MNFKRTIAAAAALICAASAVSCGKKVEGGEGSVELSMSTTAPASTEAKKTTEASTEKASEASSEKPTTSAEETTDAVTTTEAAITTAPPETTAAAPTEAPKPQGIAFDISVLGADAAPYIANLGAALDVQSAQGCLSNGADQKIYTFDGVVLSCYIQNGAEYIYDVTIKSNKYTTSMNGLTVGSSRADFEAAYGNGEESGGYVVYSSGNSEMSVKYSGDTVAIIEFYLYL